MEPGNIRFRKRGEIVTRKCKICETATRHTRIAVNRAKINAAKRARRKKKKLYSNNTTGVRGVSPFPGGKFIAQIRQNGKRRHIGLFDTIESAAQALADIAAGKASIDDFRRR